MIVTRLGDGYRLPVEAQITVDDDAERLDL